MHEPELWITKLFNDYLGGVGHSLLSLVRVEAENPSRPWTNFIVMEIVVALLIVILAAVLRGRLSVDKPGKLQHSMEVIHNFLRDQANDSIGHGSGKYISFLGTVFLFVLVGNLIGIIPTFEAPTMDPAVPAGCALAVFAYYNFQGFKEQGVWSYTKHFAGPVPALAPLMIPIEIISHLARPLSLTIRLFANMYAGEKVTLVFLGLTYLVMPAVFMGLHFFVAILQAYIFVLLTMIYIGGAVAHDEH